MSLKNLLIMIAISFAAMLLLMYAMVDNTDNIILNLNQIYMAGLMTAAMVIIEVNVMKEMYGTKTKMSMMIIAVIAGIFCLAAIRNQSNISDKEFLKSMIPHHASAILMCEKADLKDAEVKKLCKDIIASQQEQIDWMKQKLSSLK